MQARERLVGLDLIRGLCAIGVMVYHYSYLAEWGSLDGLGTFGVYIFFALSGYALYYVYGERQINEHFLRDFYIARILRIFPLFFAVAVYRSWGMELNPYNIVRLVVHGTPLVGIADVSGFRHLVVGGWSIMIEWSFYLLFPLLLLFRSTKALALLFAATLVLNLFYVLGAYYPPETIREGRHFDSTDILTFLCYFVGGMLAAHLSLQRPELVRRLVPPAPLLCGLGLMVIIFAWPEVLHFPSRKQFLSGGNAMLLTLLSCALVFLAALQNPTGWLKALSTFLGDISFALYLIHVYVWNAVGKTLPMLELPARFAISCASSILLSAVIFHFYEAPFRNLRKWRSVKAGVA